MSSATILLLYGENGSGKSSIFWGLHTLFESSLKEDEDIQKYFKHRDESAESLVNIYAEKRDRNGIDDYNSFIEVITNEEENNVYIKWINKIVFKKTILNKTGFEHRINNGSLSLFTLKTTYFLVLAEPVLPSLTVIFYLFKLRYLVFGIL